MTSATAVAAATSVVRTGKLLRPPPCSNAKRTPSTEVSDPPAAATESASRERTFAVSVPATCDDRHAGTTARAAPTTTTASAPRPSTAQSTAMPGCTSATRTAPTGPNGEAATAIAMAISAPTAIATSAFAIETVIRSRRVLPIAARVALYAASTCIRRDSDCATTTKPKSAAKAANASSASTSGSVAFSTSAPTADARLEGDGLVRCQRRDSGGESVHVDARLQLDHGAPVGGHEVGMRGPKCRREDEGGGHVTRVHHDAVLGDTDAVDARGPLL